jgi:hypothetical protein
MIHLLVIASLGGSVRKVGGDAKFLFLFSLPIIYNKVAKLLFHLYVCLCRYYWATTMRGAPKITQLKKAHIIF